MKVCLRSTSGDTAGTEYLIEETEYIIGRDVGCHLTLSVNEVSRRHCTLLLRDDGVFLRDDNSSNGTYLDERRVLGAIELRDGDGIRLGSQEFAIEIFGEATLETEPSEPKPTKEQTVIFQRPTINDDDEDSLDWDVRLKDF